MIEKAANLYCSVVISQHFVYYECNNEKTGAQNHKCKLCNTDGYPFVRRFRYAPKILVSTLNQELMKHQEDLLEQGMEETMLIDSMHKFAQEIVHDWINETTVITQRRERCYRYGYYGYKPDGMFQREKKRLCAERKKLMERDLDYVNVSYDNIV